MNLLKQLQEYRMKRFFSNNCAWTEECKKEYKALMYLINSFKYDRTHIKWPTTNIDRNFQEDMINDMDMGQ